MACYIPPRKMKQLVVYKPGQVGNPCLSAPFSNLTYPVDPPGKEPDPVDDPTHFVRGGNTLPAVWITSPTSVIHRVSGDDNTSGFSGNVQSYQFTPTRVGEMQVGFGRDINDQAALRFETNGSQAMQMQFPGASEAGAAGSNSIGDRPNTFFVVTKDNPTGIVRAQVGNKPLDTVNSPITLFNQTQHATSDVSKAQQQAGQMQVASTGGNTDTVITVTGNLKDANGQSQASSKFSDTLVGMRFRIQDPVGEYQWVYTIQSVSTLGPTFTLNLSFVSGGSMSLNQLYEAFPLQFVIDTQAAYVTAPSNAPIWVRMTGAGDSLTKALAITRAQPWWFSPASVLSSQTIANDRVTRNRLILGNGTAESVIVTPDGQDSGIARVRVKTNIFSAASNASNVSQISLLDLQNGAVTWVSNDSVQANYRVTSEFSNLTTVPRKTAFPKNIRQVGNDYYIKVAVTLATDVLVSPYGDSNLEIWGRFPVTRNAVELGLTTTPNTPLAGRVVYILANNINAVRNINPTGPGVGGVGFQAQGNKLKLAQFPRQPPLITALNGLPGVPEQDVGILVRENGRRFAFLARDDIGRRKLQSGPQWWPQSNVKLQPQLRIVGNQTLSNYVVRAPRIEGESTDEYDPDQGFTPSTL